MEVQQRASWVQVGQSFLHILECQENWFTGAACDTTWIWWI